MWKRNADLSGGNLLGRWRRALRPGSDIQVQTYYDRTNRQDVNFAEVRNTFDVDFIHHVTLPHGHDLIWGLGARFSSGNTTMVVPTVVFVPEDFTDKQYSAFVQDEITVVEKRLWLTLGSKLLHNPYTGFEAQPSARLLWRLNAQQSAWVSFTRAVRTPSRVEEHLQFTALFLPSLPAFLRLTGNRNFLSEKLLGYEAGYRGILHRTFFVDVAAFYNRYEDLVSVETQTPFVETSPPPLHVVLPVLFDNKVFGTTTGIEIAPVWTPTNWWHVKSSYSYLNMDMEREPGSIDGSSVGSLEGSSPRHQVAVQLLFDLPKGVEFDQTVRYVSGLRAGGIPSYTTGDLRVSWHPIRPLTFSVVGQNLFQPRHAEFGGDPGGLVGIRRGVYAKIGWTSDGDRLP